MGRWTISLSTHSRYTYSFAPRVHETVTSVSVECVTNFVSEL